MKPIKIECWVCRGCIQEGARFSKTEPYGYRGIGFWHCAPGWFQDISRAMLGGSVGLREGGKKKVTIIIIEGWDDND